MLAAVCHHCSLSSRDVSGERQQVEETQKGPGSRFTFSQEQGLLGGEGPAGSCRSFWPCSCTGVLSPHRSCCPWDGDSTEDEDPERCASPAAFAPGSSGSFLSRMDDQNP